MKKTFQKLAASFILGIALMTACNDAPPIIKDASILPIPVSMTQDTTCFVLPKSTTIGINDPQLRPAAEYLASILKPATGYSFKVSEGQGNINLNIGNIEGVEDSYTLISNPESVNITGNTYRGIIAGIQSLRQLFPAEIESDSKVNQSWGIPSVQIQDAPRFGWRGLMLDVSRHFYTKEEVMEFLDLMALYKLNKFHWHLTDDQGWRIEIKKYPLLTEVGSRRADSQVIGTHHRHNLAMEGVPYGPHFYTQDQIREVVAYAKERFVTIIPEIDMPGHMVAAMASYPHLGCVGEGYKVREVWGIAREVLCIGKESTFEFAQGVLEEVLPLFPSEYIHIGGDEAPRVAWAKCPHCQALMKREGLKNEAQLQSYFNHRIEKFLQQNGRRMIGWDEVLEGGVTPTTTIMSWQGTEGGIAAAKVGNKVIMTPNKFCYLSRIQSTDRANEPLYGVRHPDRPHHLSLDMAYNFNPYEGLTVEEQQNIMGLQACVWTEQIKEFSHLQYMYLPRLSAIAESAWSLPNKNFERYVNSVEELLKLYDVCGYNYAISYWRDQAKGQ